METCNDWTKNSVVPKARGPVSTARELLRNIWNEIHAVRVSKTTASIRLANTVTTVQGWSSLHEPHVNAELEAWKARAYVNTIHRQVLR